MLLGLDMAASVGPSPRKPWETAQSVSAGSSPFRPASECDNTAAVVESAGLADSCDSRGPSQHGAAISRPFMPICPYNGAGYNYNQYNNVYGMNPSYNGTYNTYNGYNSYNRGYRMSAGMYGGGYGLGNSYSGGMYGTNYGSGIHGTGMYGGGYGKGTGPVEMAGQGMPDGLGDPNNPYDDTRPSGPPSFWFSMLQKMHWTMVVLGNIVSLISESTQAFHILTTALFMFLDRSGMLAGFVLKLVRKWGLPSSRSKAFNPGLAGPKNKTYLQIKGPKSTGGAGGTWDNLWSNQSAG